MYTPLLPTPEKSLCFLCQMCGDHAHAFFSWFFRVSRVILQSCESGNCKMTRDVSAKLTKWLEMRIWFVETHVYVSKHVICGTGAQWTNIISTHVRDKNMCADVVGEAGGNERHCLLRLIWKTWPNHTPTQHKPKTNKETKSYTKQTKPQLNQTKQSTKQSPHTPNQPNTQQTKPN